MNKSGNRGFREFFKRMLNAVPDFQYMRNPIIAKGNYVWIYLRTSSLFSRLGTIKQFPSEHVRPGGRDCLKTTALRFEIRDQLHNVWVGASAPTGDDQADTICSMDKIAIKTVERIIANCRG